MSERRQRDRGAVVYDFVHPDHRLGTEWPVLEQVHQRVVDALARRLRERFRVSLRGQPGAIRRFRFDEFAAGVDASSLVNEIGLGPEPGVVLFCIDGTLVPSLVDSWFGGTPVARGGRGAMDAAASDSLAEPTEPTEDTGRRAVVPVASLSSATERRAFGHVLDAVAAAVAEGWADITELGPRPGRATTSERLGRGGYGDVVVDCPLQLSFGEVTVDARLVYPVALLEPFAARLAEEDHRHPVRDPHFHESLGAGLMDCELEIRGVLAETRITIAQLLAMKAGDFIPLKDMQNVTFRTRHTPLFDARVGKTNGRVSASLSRWHLPRRS